MTRRTTAEVLLNAAAGTLVTRDLVADIRRYFSVCGVRANVQLLRDGRELETAARRALDARPDVVVAGGGDGTMSAVAGVLAGTGMPLGVLPLGTLNHFARDVGVPPDLRSAAETACRGRVTLVDVGRVNGHVFLNNSSLGLYPQAVRRRDELRHGLRHGKWAASVWAAIWVLRRFPFFDVRMSVQGKIIERRTPLVFIGNNTYELDGFRIGARKRLDAGHLSIHIIDRTDRTGLIALAARALAGRLRQARDFETLYATHIELTTHKGHATVATDGEVGRLSMPLVYDLDQRSLSVIVPGTAEAEP
ncbi:MAG: diacylglycerol kinase family protein [Casimicrobiaceae bacterium]